MWTLLTDQIRLEILNVKIWAKLYIFLSSWFTFEFENEHLLTEL
jgi:hypothetical protein